MKKLLLVIAAVAMLLPSCKKINEELDALDARLDKLVQKTIPTIDEQIVAINASLDALDAMDKELKGYIDGLTATASNLQEQINTLKTKDEELDKKIADLKTYVDTELGKTTDWVKATFATLEQFTKLSGEVASLKSLVDANKAEAAANLATAISKLETSLKSWVGEQLSNYYTIAEVDAKISALQTAITNGDNALQEELKKLKTQLETTKSEITEAYKKSIKEAIEINNGVIDQKIADEIATVNSRIDSEVAAINTKIAAIEARLGNVEAQIKDLLARIQSVSYIPTYSDGKATLEYTGNVSKVTLDFEISPKDAVAELAKVWQDAVTLKAVYTQTRAVTFIDMPIVKFESAAENGVISITASGENLSKEFFAGTQEASVALTISDGNNSVVSDYVFMVAKKVAIEEVIPDNQIWYTSSDGSVVEPYRTNVFGANIVSNTYANGKGVIVFDAPVTSIGSFAFQGCTSLTSVTIPDSVTEIGMMAFEYCTSLTSATIPDSVTSIGGRAFRGCTSLTAFYGKYASADNRCLIVDGVLTSFAPAGLTEYTIPDSVTSIGLEAFYGCSSLKSVTIPNSVTSIECEAFYGCSSLTSVTIPNSVTSIGEIAFEGCTSLTSVTIPDSVTEIGEGAFEGCTSLTSVTIGNSVTSIGEVAFEGCTSLKAFYGKFASLDNRCLIVDGVLNSFAPAGLTEYTIPNSVTEIGYGALGGCTSLTSVTIPNSVNEIGYAAFAVCTSLTSVTIPDSVTSIGKSAFQNCYQLTSVTIGNSVTSIGYDAFYDCISLTSVTIPNSVTSIGEGAFEGCTLLKEVYCKPTTPPAGNRYMFSKNASGRKIYVPRNSVSKYESARYWSDYASYIEGYDF